MLKQIKGFWAKQSDKVWPTDVCVELGGWGKITVVRNECKWCKEIQQRLSSPRQNCGGGGDNQPYQLEVTPDGAQAAID